MSPTTRRADVSDPKNRAGLLLVLSALLLAVILSCVAIAADVGYLVLVRTQLQVAADAASLAATQDLPNHEAAWLVAEHYATENHPHGLVVTPADVVVGNWNADSLTFIPGAAPVNAVEVTVRRSIVSNNPVTLFFAPLRGVTHTDVVASAIAVATQQHDCWQRGVTAGNRVTIGQDVCLDNYCVYGRNGVSFGQEPRVINGAKVGVLDESTVSYGQDPVGLPEHIVEADKQPELAHDIETIIDNLELGIDLPPQITIVQVVSKLPKNLTNGTAYVINGNVSIGRDNRVKDVIIAARGKIQWGHGGAIHNSGNPDSDFAIGLFATTDITIGQDAIVEGANLVAGRDVNIGPDPRSVDATIQAARNVSIGQDPHFTGPWRSAMPGSSNGGGGPMLVH